MSLMRRCDFCQKPYDEEQPRSPSEMERIRSVLFVTGPAATIDRPVCDSCYENVVYTANRRNNESSLDVGGSNRGPPNLLLQRIG